MVDLAGQSTTLLYDLLNRPTRLTQPGAAVTTTGYVESASAHTVTTTVTDPRSLAVSGVTNALGWATQTTDAQSATAHAGYDRNGALRRAVDRASGVVIADYDSLGRVTRQIAGADTTTFLYDAGTHATDPHWRVAITRASRDSVAFDAVGRPTLVATTRGGGSPSTATTTTLASTYDDAGLRTVLTVSGTGGGAWSRTLHFGRTATFDSSLLPEFGRTGGNVLALTADGAVDTLAYQTNGSSLRLHPSAYTSRHQPA